MLFLVYCQSVDRSVLYQQHSVILGENPQKKRKRLHTVSEERSIAATMRWLPSITVNGLVSSIPIIRIALAGGSSWRSWVESDRTLDRKSPFIPFAAWARILPAIWCNAKFPLAMPRQWDRGNIRTRSRSAGSSSTCHHSVPEGSSFHILPRLR